jgi:hypothetical protein
VWHQRSSHEPQDNRVQLRHHSVHESPKAGAASKQAESTLARRTLRAHRGVVREVRSTELQAEADVWNDYSHGGIHRRQSPSYVDGHSWCDEAQRHVFALGRINQRGSGATQEETQKSGLTFHTIRLL